jgi:IclR family acetate operon transcriptional repressor
MESGARKPPAYPIASVDKALTLLMLLGERKQVRVSEAATMLGTARSTAHRLLAMLEYHGFARQDAETMGYALGPALLELGLTAMERLDLRTLARPLLERLSADVGETVHLVRLQDASVVFLDSVETSRALRIGSRVGRSMPAHCTASGKAILAQMERDQLRRLYPRTKLTRMTPRSPSTRAELEAQLVEVRERGYATNFGEAGRRRCPSYRRGGTGGGRRARRRRPRVAALSSSATSTTTVSTCPSGGNRSRSSRWVTPDSTRIVGMPPERPNAAPSAGPSPTTARSTPRRPVRARTVWRTSDDGLPTTVAEAPVTCARPAATVAEKLALCPASGDHRNVRSPMLPMATAAAPRSERQQAPTTANASKSLASGPCGQV